MPKNNSRNRYESYIEWKDQQLDRINAMEEGSEKDREMDMFKLLAGSRRQMWALSDIDHENVVASNRGGIIIRKF